jgi:hypothetical protein
VCFVQYVDKNTRKLSTVNEYMIIVCNYVILFSVDQQEINFVDVDSTVLSILTMAGTKPAQHVLYSMLFHILY